MNKMPVQPEISANTAFGKMTSSLKEFASSKLARRAGGTFGLKIGATALKFLSTLLLTRLIGVAGYGAYNYTLAGMTLLVLPSVLGFDKLLVREVATFRAKKAWGLLRGVLAFANRIVLMSSLLVAGAAAGIILLFGGEQVGAASTTALILGLVLIPVTALTRLRQAALQGLNRVILGNSAERLIRPLLFILFLLVSYAILGDRLNAIWAVGLYVTAGIATFILGIGLLFYALPKEIKSAKVEYDTRGWITSTVPLMLLGGMQVIHTQTDTLMVGMLAGATATGLYVVAYRGAELIAFILMAVNAALGPTFASLYADRKLEALQALITKSARAILLVSIPVACGLIFFGHWFLAIFGAEFQQSRTALTVLSIGQIVNAFTGSVTTLLIMTKHARDAAVGMGISSIVNIALNAILIPMYGIEGAAIATATSLGVWNLTLVVFAHRRLNMGVTAIGKL